jgi:hypothetical protein
MLLVWSVTSRHTSAIYVDLLFATSDMGDAAYSLRTDPTDSWIHLGHTHLLHRRRR